MSHTWCGGLTTPIYKSGVRSDPANYLGICVSSCLGKLFCSILNQRLLEDIVSLNILQKSQIGFLPNNRRADHVFTLRTLIDKYVHNHNEKIYACFVDFKKALTRSGICLLYTSPSPRDGLLSRMPSSA